MPAIKVWIQAVWSTKGRFPFLTDKIREEVFRHMAQNARSKRIVVERINGHLDHVHVLIYLRSTQTLAFVINHLKGESSRWINKNRLTDNHFEWQTDYFASSVSESVLPIVRQYIDHQQAHHRNTSRTSRQDPLPKFLKIG